ncbi:hypothetical protein HPT25_14340 [Bacillus sp. BRMEA1]|uniref:hypothetical protein n=1 Tax=Neobacillus endophyticus TaxID=2738405 RepID=UPI001565A00C|nr:hypothetical protein [Neobacillus endophyticus]NRD78540.1 hypothetical protein [Neobacillus endophyticus]
MEKSISGIYLVINNDNGAFKIDKTKEIKAAKEKYSRPNFTFQVLSEVISQRGYNLNDLLELELEQQQYDHINNLVSSLGLSDIEQKLMLKEETDYLWSTRRSV